jgi:hypothetical protein
MKKYKAYILAGVAILIAAGAAVYYFYLRSPAAEEATGLMPKPYTVADKTKVEDISGSTIEPIVVALDKSDDLVRTLVKQLSSHSGFGRWLMTDNLIRRFVSITDVIAYGRSPRRNINFVDLKQNFQVNREEGGKEFIDPKSYKRYRQIADIFVSLDTEGCVKLYRQLRLPIGQAYKDLGYTEEDFNETLKKAILELIQTPVADQRIYVERNVLTYKFDDPELEKLNPAQKHLIRMGPDNMRAVQAKLTEIAQALDFLD